MIDPDPGRPAAPPVFLERQGYRRRRLMDAAKLLPIFGAALFAVPLLWPDVPSGDDTEPVRLSGAMLYVFSVWAILIALAALFGVAARLWGQSASSQPDPDAEAGQSPTQGGG